VEGILADEVDYVVGVDPHRDAHALAIVHAGTGGAVGSAQVTANARGYAQALRLAEREAPGRRAWAIEGTGSYGAGLARFLVKRGESVLEVGRTRRERRSHAKTDALDALRTARSMLGEAELASPRAAGEREALRALMVARAGALAAKKAGLCQLRALVVTCPEPLRGELRSLTRAQLLRQPQPARAVAGVGPDPTEYGGAADAVLSRVRIDTRCEVARPDVVVPRHRQPRIERALDPFVKGTDLGAPLIEGLVSTSQLFGVIRVGRQHSVRPANQGSACKSG
jgi:hypothetical protein